MIDGSLNTLTAGARVTHADLGAGAVQTTSGRSALITYDDQPLRPTWTDSEDLAQEEE